MKSFSQYRHQELQFPVWYVGGILGQKMSTQSLEWQPYVCLLYANTDIICNIRVKGDKMEMENNPIRLPLDT